MSTTTTTTTPVYGPFQTFRPIAHDPAAGHVPADRTDDVPTLPAAADGPFAEWSSPGSSWTPEDGYRPGVPTEWTEPKGDRGAESVTWCRGCGMVPGTEPRSRRERATWAACDHEDLTAHKLTRGADTGRTALDHGWTDRDAVVEKRYTDWTVPVPYVGANSIGKQRRVTTTVVTRGVHVVKRYRVRATGKGATPVPNGLTTFAHVDYDATTVARQAISAGTWPTRSSAARVATPDRGAIRVGKVTAPEDWHGPARYVPTTVGATYVVPVAHVTTTVVPASVVRCSGLTGPNGLTVTTVRPTPDPDRHDAYNGPKVTTAPNGAPERVATWTEHRPARHVTTTTVEVRTVTTAPEAVPVWEAAKRTKSGAVDGRRVSGRQGGKGRKGRSRRAGKTETRRVPGVDPAALAAAIAAADAAMA